MNLAKSNIHEPFIGMICYAGFFISGLIIFILEKENRRIRFHAMQSGMVFGGIFVLILATQFFPFFWLLGTLFTFTGFALWIMLMWKAFQGEMYKVPYIGDLAEQQIAIIDKR